MHKLLDNIFWHTLVGPHAKFAIGANGARRYAPGFSPIVGFANAERPDFDALTPICEPGEHFYCSGWTGPAPAGWCIEADSTMFCMVRDTDVAVTDEAPEAVRLGPEHGVQAQELAALTRPGPFGPRTIELGDYFGCFEGPRLVAMAGERLHAGTLREISGICTHPDFRGRGFARRLMNKVLTRQLERREIPFLHVMCDNTSAHRLYEQMGFRDYRIAVVRIISRC